LKDLCVFKLASSSAQIKCDHINVCIHGSVTVSLTMKTYLCFPNCTVNQTLFFPQETNLKMEDSISSIYILYLNQFSSNFFS